MEKLRLNLDALRQDFRYAIRTLRRSRGFTATAILTLGIAITLNTAVFSLVNGYLFRPPAVADVDRLAVVGEQRAGFEAPGALSLSVAEAVGTETRSLEGVGAHTRTQVTIGGGADAEVQRASRVSPDLFEVLGIRPMEGRGFVPDDARPGAEPVVILGARLHERRFAAEPLVGRRIAIDGEPRTVVGIVRAVPGVGLDDQVWMPLAERSDDATAAAATATRLIGRLRAGVSPAQANAELSALGESLKELGGYDLEGTLVADEDLVGRAGGLPAPLAALLLGAAGCVLLIACANVANLMVARGVRRSGEVRVRVALGASRTRVMRQIFAEAAVLAAGGAALGLLLSVWATDALVSLLPGSNGAAVPDIGIDGRVLAFTLGASVVAALGAGLLPAVTASRARPGGALQGATGTGVVRPPRAGMVLVASEVALGFVLLSGTLLIGRTFLSVADIDPGADVDRVLTLEFTQTGEGTRDPAQQIPSRTRMRQRLRGAAGVEEVALDGRFAGFRSSFFASNDSAAGDGSIYLEGQPGEPALPAFDFQVRVVDPTYFQTVGLGVEGRGLLDSDRQDQSGVAVVSERLAELLRADEPVRDERLRLGEHGPWLTVVGTAADMRVATFGRGGVDVERQPILYLPSTQALAERPRWLVRTAGDPVALVPSLRAAVYEIDPTRVLAHARPLSDEFGVTATVLRWLSGIFAVFAAGAVGLVLLGIHGLVAFIEAQRSREIGIRIALGATSDAVLRGSLLRGVRIASVGLLIGAGGAFALGQAVSGFVYGVTPADPLSLGTVAIVLTATALVAAYGPARRAARADPMEALRAER